MHFSENSTKRVRYCTVQFRRCRVGGQILLWKIGTNGYSSRIKLTSIRGFVLNLVGSWCGDATGGR